MEQENESSFQNFGFGQIDSRNVQFASVLTPMTSASNFIANARPGISVPDQREMKQNSLFPRLPVYYAT